MKLIRLGLLFVAICGALTALPAAITPLAQTYVTVGESPDPQKIPLYTPSILRLPSGRLLAAYEQGGEQRLNGEPWAFILSSDDHGKTWQQRGRAKITHGRLFAAGNSLYYLGHSAVLVGTRPEDRSGDLRILRSDDAGLTWSGAADLTHGQQWHESAANVWHAKGNVYLVMERRVSDEIAGWFVGELAPVLMRAAETADLMQAGSWTFASELDFTHLIPGYRSNQLGVDFFGVPFFPSAFPAGAPVGGGRMSAPLGWARDQRRGRSRIRITMVRSQRPHLPPVHARAHGRDRICGDGKGCRATRWLDADGARVGAVGEKDPLAAAARRDICGFTSPTIRSRNSIGS